MTSRTKRFRFLRRPNRAKGGALIEAALVLPIVIGFGFTVMDYSYFFFIKNTIQGAALAAREPRSPAPQPTQM